MSIYIIYRRGNIVNKRRRKFNLDSYIECKGFKTIRIEEPGTNVNPVFETA